MARRLGMLALCLAALSATALADGPLRAGVFAVDASPPIGSPMAYDPTKEVVHPLSCRGVVLIGDGAPVVLCAVDWIGIGNDGQAESRAALAQGINREVFDADFARGVIARAAPRRSVRSRRRRGR